MTTPSIYEGTVVHERRGEHHRRFTYRVAMPMVELDELASSPALAPFWRAEGRAPMNFRRLDFMGDPARPLASVVRDTVGERCGFRPDGPILLLAQHRTWGWCFNPLALYYCYASDGETLEAVVADVTNTPWGESHAYVLDTRGGLQRHEQPKQMHVSPFLPMDLSYRFHVAPPGARCGVSIAVLRGEDVVFRAALSLVRHDMTRRELVRVLLRHPFQTHRVSLAIYLRALLLRASRVPFFAHPSPTR
ncbi:MAG TPA: DUF1365 domain-containing protein [Acidimicrobiales bacterium]|nr:DUF1365 domain-containing protein [Acidimicrobiales bacterium]